MKKIIVLLIAVCPSFVAMSQKDSSFFEIGMNVRALISQFDRDQSRFEWSPYLFTLEKSFGKYGFRAGLGFYQNQSEELASPSNGNTNFNVDTTALDVRLGLVFYKNLNEKWSFRYGVDAVISNQSTSRNTTFTDPQGEVSETMLSVEKRGVGAAPFFFAQYHFSKKVSIGTEIGFRWLNQTILEEDLNDTFPEFNESIEKVQTSLSLLAPTSLFLIVRL